MHIIEKGKDVKTKEEVIRTIIDLYFESEVSMRNCWNQLSLEVYL